MLRVLPTIAWADKTYKTWQGIGMYCYHANPSGQETSQIKILLTASDLIFTPAPVGDVSHKPLITPTIHIYLSNPSSTSAY